MNNNRNQIKKGLNCEILPLEIDKKILTTDFESIYPCKISNLSRHIAPDKFVKIILNNGRELTVTTNHPCWSMFNGKIATIPAESLRTGDFFPIPSELPLEGEEQTFNFEPFKNGPLLCKLLGYHITDGSYELNRGRKNGIQFWNNDKKLIEDYSQCIKLLFGLEPGLVKRGNQFAVRVVSKEVAEMMLNLDKNLMEKGNVKKIPEQIMKCKKEDIALLLRALFDGDGTVVNVKGGGCRATLVCENKELAEQVTELLLRFGILSSIYKDKNVLRVDITGQENLLKYYSYIGFLSSKKSERLKTYLDKEKMYRSISDVVPGVTQTIKNIFKRLKINEERDLGNQICMNCEKHRVFLQKMIRLCENKIGRLLDSKKIAERTINSQELGKLRESLGFSILGISQKLGLTDYMLSQYEKKGIENENYQKVLVTEINSMISVIPQLYELKKLAFGKIRWSKIKSVEIIDNKDIKWVYDIAIEPTHAFISNNMVLHNSVTISKANVQASLRAETSVLAAGNPKFGRFDPYQAIAQQIDIQPTLLNRFDVIFMLRDLPDKSKDDAIASHVLFEQQHSSQRGSIEPELFRKYIAYAKQRIIPKLSDEAVAEIKNFYVTLRNAPTQSDSPLKPIPITARQLEALVRLSESSAKTRLSMVVEKDDALRAINLMKFYLMQAGYDYESKSFDIDKIVTGVTASKRGRINEVREMIYKLESRIGKLIPIEELEKDIGEKISRPDLEEALDKLAIAGDIFYPKKGYIQRT
jgi:replicative DNA helicase Mcm